MKQQRGFLLIVALIIITVVAMLGSFLVYMYVGKVWGTRNIKQANAAFYVATSGLEIAKHDFFKNQVACTDITYHEVELPGEGYYTVAGSVVTTMLAKALGTTTDIVLTDVTGLPVTGAIKIEDEIVLYNGIKGYELLNVRRGAYGSRVKCHPVSAVTSFCILKAIGYVPTVSAYLGKRILQQEVAQIISLGNLQDNDGNPITPAIVSAGGIVFKGSASTTNSLVATGGQVTIAGHPTIGGSRVDNCAAYPNVCLERDEHIQAREFFNYFYSGSIYDFRDVAVTVGYGEEDLINFTGQGVIWVHGDLHVTGSNLLFQHATGPVTLVVNGNITISGSPTIANPVAMLSTGNVVITGNPTLTGFLYSTGDVVLAGSVLIEGAVAAQNVVHDKGNVTINYNQDVINALGLGKLVPVMVSVPEVF